MCLSEKEDQNPLVQIWARLMRRMGKGRFSYIRLLREDRAEGATSPRKVARVFRIGEAPSLRGSCAKLCSAPTVGLNHRLGSGANDQDSNSSSSTCDENLISPILFSHL